MVLSHKIFITPSVLLHIAQYNCIVQYVIVQMAQSKLIEPFALTQFG